MYSNSNHTFYEKHLQTIYCRTDVCIQFNLVMKNCICILKLKYINFCKFLSDSRQFTSFSFKVCNFFGKRNLCNITRLLVPNYINKYLITGCICMPQKVIQTENHRFSWDLHHWTPLGRGSICQNIFGLCTVHMG